MWKGKPLADEFATGMKFFLAIVGKEIWEASGLGGEAVRGGFEGGFKVSICCGRDFFLSVAKWRADSIGGSADKKIVWALFSVRAFYDVGAGLAWLGDFRFFG